MRLYQSKTKRKKYYILSKKSENKIKGKRPVIFMLGTIAKIFLNIFLNFSKFFEMHLILNTI